MFVLGCSSEVALGLKQTSVLIIYTMNGEVGGVVKVKAELLTDGGSL